MSALECKKVTICGLAYCQGLTLNNLACDKELWSVLLDFSDECRVGPHADFEILHAVYARVNDLKAYTLHARVLTRRLAKLPK